MKIDISKRDISKREPRQLLLDELCELFKKNTDLCCDLQELTLTPGHTNDPRRGYDGLVFAFFDDGVSKYYRVIEIGKAQGLELIQKVAKELRHPNMSSTTTKNLAVEIIRVACHDYRFACEKLCKIIMLPFYTMAKDFRQGKQFLNLRLSLEGTWFSRHLKTLILMHSFRLLNIRKI